PNAPDGTGCNDGKACTQVDTCQTGVCKGTNPVDCSAAGDQCNSGVCTEPAGACMPIPKINGFACEDGNPCTSGDKCRTGVCIPGTDSGDSDGDGYCDAQEVAAECNPEDPQEIPPQA